MNLVLPQGADNAGRKKVYLQGLRALRRIVVELAEGVLSVRTPDGSWHDLGRTDITESVAIHLLKTGRIFPFLSPDWEEKVRAAYETKRGKKLPRGIAEADKNRWETRPPTPETILDGLPLHIQLAGELEKRGLTQAQGAKELGVSAMSMSRWIRGNKPISLGSAAKIRAWITKGD